MRAGAPLRALAESRSGIYWLLGSCYLAPPDRGFLEELSAKLGPLEEEGVTEIAAGLGSVKDAIHYPLEETERRLGVEFTRLFRGLKEGYGPPPPYESVYRESRLVGETTLAVMAKYAAAGFGTIDESAGPQDHLGVELKFMSLLCHQEMQAWEVQAPETAIRCLSLEREFLQDHLLLWVPAFSRSIEQHAREGYYLGMIGLTRGVLVADQENITELLAEAETG